MGLSKYFGSDLAKNIAILTSGTMVAQMVAYLLAPIISRIYLPEEIAEMGLFIRIISIGATIATLRYELALPIVKTDSHAFRLYRFASRTVVKVALFSFVLVLIPLFVPKGLSNILFYLLVPIGIAFSAYTSLGINWSIRLKKFKKITYSKLTNSVSINVLKVLFGVFGWGYIGLILATVFGLIAGALFFLIDYAKGIKSKNISAKSIRNSRVAKEFIEFPTVNLPHALSDLIRDLVMALLIWEIFSKMDYGLYNHTYQMLRLPLMLVGASISQVFFQRIAEKVNKKEDVMPITLQSIKVLFLVSILPFGIIFFFGEELFEFVFGANWKKAGTFAEIMAPWFMVNLIASPISSLPMVLKKQKAFFVSALIGSSLMVLAMAIPGYILKYDVLKTLWILSISQTIFLIIIIFVILSFIKKYNIENKIETNSNID